MNDTPEVVYRGIAILLALLLSICYLSMVWWVGGELLDFYRDRTIPYYLKDVPECMSRKAQEDHNERMEIVKEGEVEFDRSIRYD